MSRGGRLGLIAAAVAVAVVAFLIARPGGDDDDSNENARGSAETTTTQTGPRAEPAPPPEPRVDRIRVRDGEPVGGVKEIEVEKGDQVRLEVTADISEHVHVHGYDRFQDVAPGRPARFRFKADIEGIFEIELEDSHTPIAELRVEP